MKTFDDYWKETKPAECDELKQYFVECWYVSQSEQFKKDSAVIGELRAALEAISILVKVEGGRPVAVLALARDAIARTRGTSADREPPC